MAYGDQLISSTIGAELYTNLLQEAIFTAQEQSVARNVVKTYMLGSNEGKTFQVPVYPTIAANNIAEGTDLVDVALNPTSVNITLAELGVMTLVSDLMLESAAVDVAADVGRIMGEALAKKMDQDVMALFSSFSSSIGDDETELVADTIFQAAATLRSASVPGPYFGVFHPAAMYNLKKTLINNGAAIADLSETGNEALRSGIVGSIAGVTRVESTNVASVSRDCFIGGVFAPMAIGMAVGRDIRIEEERNASLRAFELVGSMTVGQAVLKDTYGVAITSDGTIGNE